MGRIKLEPTGAEFEGLTTLVIKSELQIWGGGATPAEGNGDLLGLASGGSRSTECGHNAWF